MDPELGFIQDLNDLLDKTATSNHVNKKYKYSLQIPEFWSDGSYYNDTNDDDSFFSFIGGHLEILADNQKSYADSVKDEDAYQKKSGGNDPEYKYEASDVTLFGEAAKQYVVHYSTRKIPYKETVYIFRKNNITYKATLNIDEAVRTDENEARLNKTFESMTFTNK
jgi:serine protease Do